MFASLLQRFSRLVAIAAVVFGTIGAPAVIADPLAPPALAMAAHGLDCDQCEYDMHPAPCELVCGWTLTVPEAPMAMPAGALPQAFPWAPQTRNGLSAPPDPRPPRHRV